MANIESMTRVIEVHAWKKSSVSQTTRHQASDDGNDVGGSREPINVSGT